jgi:HD-GYP domain-containing protein (c-di-GMP phosphodiesterase class II)
MRLVNVREVTKGMKLAKPIFHKGNIMLNTGCKNLPIYIEDKKSRDIEVKDIIKTNTRNKCKKVVREAFRKISLKKTVNIKAVKKVVEDLIDEILVNNNLVVNLIDIKSSDSYTFDHSVNVTTLSILLGKSMNLNRKDLFKLGLGAIFHDIGKILIPEDILKKPSKLNDEEYKVIKKHPELGHSRVKKNTQIGAVSRAIIRQHHENYDGGGYPKGKKKNNIHLFSRITAVADVYDALTSDRCYRSKWPASRAMDLLLSQSEKKFDPQIVNLFFRNISIYPNGTKVILSNGKEALIKEQNDNFPMRPIIKIINESKEENKIINLVNNLNIVIAEAIY